MSMLCDFTCHFSMPKLKPLEAEALHICLLCNLCTCSPSLSSVTWLWFKPLQMRLLGFLPPSISMKSFNKAFVKLTNR